VYYDAVLDDDMMPLFNGTEDETVDWLLKNEQKDLQVAVGRTNEIIPAEEYMERNGAT
jgi:hypothetical protein